jgi:hypothetical protein
MPDPVAKFFERVSRHGHEPRLDWADSIIRFDLRVDERVEHWLVRITHGNFQVSQEDAPAEVVFSADRAMFERIVEGAENVYAAWLRDELRLKGNAALFQSFWRFSRVVPGPPGGHHPRAFAKMSGSDS